MKHRYLLNIVIGLTLGCIFVHCKHLKDERSRQSAVATQEYQESSPIKHDSPTNKIYEYKFTIDNAAHELELSNYQRVNWRNEKPLYLSKFQIKALNGTYVWESRIYFESQREMFDYICEHFEEMQKYKISSYTGNTNVYNKSSVKEKNIYDEYNDRLDEYLDDPEDEIEFDPEIFDFLDD